MSSELADLMRQAEAARADALSRGSTDAYNTLETLLRRATLDDARTAAYADAYAALRAALRSQRDQDHVVFNVEVALDRLDERLTSLG